ncbi:hypothetical protein D3C87_1336760 [compost metagenome]
MPGRVPVGLVGGPGDLGQRPIAGMDDVHVLGSSHGKVGYLLSIEPAPEGLDPARDHIQAIIIPVREAPCAVVREASRTRRLHVAETRHVKGAGQVSAAIHGLI